MKSYDAAVWSTPSNGLRLGLARAAPGLRICLENTGRVPLTVFSHVLAGGRPHLDWFELHLEYVSGKQRRLRFFADRDEAAPVEVLLDPGARLHHDIDVAYWALQAVNGNEPLDACQYRAHAEYRVSPAEAGGRWSGSLRTPVLP
jgi:hypothetical protein